MPNLVPVKDTILAKLGRARALLAEARDATDAKKVADLARAAEVYARRQKLSQEAIDYAHAVKVDAMTLMGEFLKAKPPNPGARGSAGPGRGKRGAKTEPRFAATTLADLGIGKKESAAAQVLFDLKKKHAALHEQVRRGDKTVTQVKRGLKDAARDGRRQANRAKVAQVASPVELVGVVHFPTIVIDPPWDWGDEGDADQLGRARPDYATWPIEKVAQLPVGGLSDVDCHLYLWITNRSLPKGFALLEGWGFRYVTCLTWCKPHFGMGNYFRGQTEQILFGVKGSQPLKRKDAGTWFQAARGSPGHSSKPNEFYELVESCSPGPYLEMFSRSERPDWTHWGENSQ